MIARHRRTISIVWVAVVVARATAAHCQSPVLPVGEQPAPTPSASIVVPAVDERFKKQHELITALVEKHGYRLAEGELLKYIKDPQNEERIELRRLMMSSPGMGKFMPERGEDALEPFMHVLHMLPDGRIPFSTVSDGVITLGDVLDDVLRLRPYELDCPPNVRLTYMPGDWVLSYESDNAKKLTDAGAATLEKILNEQCNLEVRVGWRMIERPAITIRGKYTPKPAGGKLKDEREAAISDGIFLIDARRALSFHPNEMSGDFDQFIDSIGYLLMMPVVVEVETKPTKQMISWREAGKGIEGSDRLKLEHEQSVLNSLHEQLGYDVTVEPQEVKLLSIQPREQ